MTPAAVVLDPELTLLTPDALWAGSGLKAIDHGIEGVLLGGGRPLADPLALAGIAQLARTLATSVDPRALDCRLACQLAAWQCYAAPASTRLGLSHRIGQVLGGSFGVPHSLTSGITLPPVLGLFATRTPVEAASIAAALMQATDDRPAAPPAPADSARALRRVVELLGLPNRLRDVDVDRADAGRAADLVSELYPHEAALAGDGLEALLQEMW